MTDLRYPIGRFERPTAYSDSTREAAVDELERLPTDLRVALSGLTDPQLDTPYRPDGWTVRQLVHHVADSHMNAYVRLRLALTEDSPTIRPYDEARWAMLADAQSAPAELSLALLDALHQRWTMLFRSLRPDDFARTLRHPERGPMTLDDLLALYSWHGRHHVAHVTTLRIRLGW